MMPEPMTVATRKRVPRDSAVTLLRRDLVDIGVHGRTRKGKKAKIKSSMQGTLVKKVAVQSSLQLRVLRFSLFQDGNVGVGVFPEREEVLVGGECTYAGGVGIRSLRGTRL